MDEKSENKEEYSKAEDPGDVDALTGEEFEPDVTLFDLPWDDVLFPYVLPYLSIQTQFQLRRVSVLGLELMKEFFSQVKSVNIARIAGRMTKSAFHIITGNNTNIHHLNLRNAKDWLTDEVLIPVLKSNPRLEYVDFTKCTSVTNASLQVLAVKCPKLKSLVLTECPWVSPEGLTVIALNCHHLETLDISGCWNIDNDSMSVLAMSCPRIKSLNVSKIYGLNDGALIQLIRRCLQLSHLNIQGCWRLTDDSIRFLGEYGKNLKILQLRECHQVTEMSLARLRENNVKMDRRPPPDINNARLDKIGFRFKHRLHVAI